MARPRKTGLDYFPFDIDFFSDEKMVAVAGEFGLKGEIVAIHLLCAIYRNGYFIEWTEMMRYKMLKELPGISADLLDGIVRRLAHWGFFDKTLLDSARVLTSRGIQRRYFEASRKRKIQGDLPYILSFCDVNPPKTVVSASETPVSASETPQSKVKKSKKEKNIICDDTKKPPVAAVAPEVLVDETLGALTAPEAAEEGARLVGVTPSRFVDLARAVAAEWRFTLDFDRDNPRRHMLSTIRCKHRAATGNPVPRPQSPTAHTAPQQSPSRPKPRPKDDNPLPNGIGGYEEYCRMRGLDPTVRAAEQSRRLADDDTPDFLKTAKNDKANHDYGSKDHPCI